MSNSWKWMAAGIAGAVLGAIAIALPYARSLVSIGAAYKAKMLCSGVFIAGREPQSILGSDLSVDDLAVLRCLDSQVDYTQQWVTAGLPGLVKRKAVYRAGLGCTLAYDALELPCSVAVTACSTPIRQGKRDRDPWLTGEMSGPGAVPRQLDQALLDAAVDWAFAEPDPDLPRRTRAVVVVHRQRIVAERYAPGFSEHTPLIGWSMTKSVINALIGILVKEGRLSLFDPAPVPEWHDPDDPRHPITLDQLLHMSSGLKFKEDYGNPLADVTHMLLGVPDMAAYAAHKELEAEPGTRWSYASGTTNIISRIIREVVGEAHYLAFAQCRLFDRIGMHSAVIEVDASGTLVGSSFMYATARDWARFGLLYLQDGVWEGERILPEGWVAYTRTPAPQVPNGDYGGHFWRKLPREFRGPESSTTAAEEALHAIGHEGQFVTILPSRDLVIVRLGLTRLPHAWDHQAFVGLVLKALAE